MLILPDSVKDEQLREHEEAKAGIAKQFNKELENLLNAHKAHDKYWVLGKLRFPPELGGKVGKVFLQACLEKPPLVRDAFLYEVNSRAGTKTLLWVMHPTDELVLPTIGKTVRTAVSKKNDRILGVK